jgi:hypothetical protein
MTAEVRLILAGKEATLVLKLDDRETESEAWKLDRRPTKAEVEEIARCVFQDAYQVLQYATHER